MKRRLLKASQERQEFHDLIGTAVTFAHELITIGGQITHTIGEKAVITDVEYVTGYWSKLCPDIWTPPKINTIQINGQSHTCFLPDTFHEFKKVENEK